MESDDRPASAFLSVMPAFWKLRSGDCLSHARGDGCALEQVEVADAFFGVVHHFEEAGAGGFYDS